MSENRYNKQSSNREVISPLHVEETASAEDCSSKSPLHVEETASGEDCSSKRPLHVEETASAEDYSPESPFHIEETASAEDCSSIKLNAENELRLKAGECSGIKIELSSGLAEIYGSEMDLNKEYSFPPNAMISIFTWEGCVIKVTGKPEDIDILKDTQMILSVVLHAFLEERRLRAVATNKKGPVLLVVGPNDVNRNALCRLLLNYAARMRRSPLFIDLDVAQNSISLPSSIGILPVEKPADIVSGFDDHAIEVYQYGYRRPWQNMRLYSLLVQRLGKTLKSRLRQANKNVRTSGVIINGCDWSRAEILRHGYAVVTHVVKNFELDALCVLEEESLYQMLKRKLPSSVNLMFIPKFEGDSDRCRHIKNFDREIRIHEYFYGPTNQLQHFTFEVNFSDIKVFKIVANSIKKDIHALADVQQSDVELMPVLNDVNLLYQILGLSSADNVYEDIMHMPVVCFICVTKVDLLGNTITVLSPQPSPLSKKIFLMGDTKIKKRH